MDIRAAIGNCRLFKSLTADDIERIVAMSSQQSHPAETVIVTEGDVADGLYIVLQGKVALEAKTHKGARTRRDSTIDMIGPGGVFGWTALVPPYVHRASAVCREPVVLVAIDGVELRSLLENDSSLGLKVMRRLIAMVSERNSQSREHFEYFISVVSHEVKAPLSAIESYLQVLLGGFVGELSDKQRNMLERASSRANELLCLLNDLVDSSRFEGAQIVRDLQSTSVESFISRSIEDVTAQARAKDIEMDVRLPHNLPPIVVAPVRMRQVFTNLLSNAVKYTPPGGKVVLVAAEAGDSVLFEVVDNGIGIPANDLPWIFDDFYRAGNVEERGLGLGLAIAKKIVEAHSGHIWVESPYPRNSNRGSRFGVLIPKNHPS